MASGNHQGRYNSVRATTSSKPKHNHHHNNQQQQAAEVPIDIPVDISFLDTPLSERTHQPSKSKRHNKNGGLDEKNLFSIVGEIGRLQAIEQEIRSRSRAVQEQVEIQKENAALKQRASELEVEVEVETCKQKLAAQDAQMAKLRKDAKRVKDLEQVLREKDESQQKADDSFASAMEELMQKQRQLEMRDREVLERNQAVDLKEKQMRDQAGHQERSLKEIQSLVWAREQQIWDMEQMARISQENYQKQIAALQAELQKHEEAKQQSQAMAPAPAHQQAPGSDPMVAAPASQIDSWNANLPLLDQETLVSLVKQFLPYGGKRPDLVRRRWTPEDLAKLDTFLLPHSWATHYQSIYGTIEDFVQRHYESVGSVPGAGGAMPGVVVTPMPAAAPAEVAEVAENQAVAPSPRGAKGQRHQGKASGGKRANRRNRKQQPANGNANGVVAGNKI